MILDEFAEEAIVMVSDRLIDRDGQTMLSGREDPFGFVVFPLPIGGPLHATIESRGAFERDPHELEQFSAQTAQRAERAAVTLLQLLADVERALANLDHLVQQRLQSVRAEVELFNQANGLVPATDQAPPGGMARLHRLTLADRNVEILAILPQQLDKRAKIRA